jgi:hypothetical protein
MHGGLSGRDGVHRRAVGGRVDPGIGRRQLPPQLGDPGAREDVDGRIGGERCVPDRISRERAPGTAGCGDRLDGRDGCRRTGRGDRGDVRRPGGDDMCLDAPRAADGSRGAYGLPGDADPSDPRAGAADAHRALRADARVDGARPAAVDAQADAIPGRVQPHFDRSPCAPGSARGDDRPPRGGAQRDPAHRARQAQPVGAEAQDAPLAIRAPRPQTNRELRRGGQRAFHGTPATGARPGVRGRAARGRGRGGDEQGGGDSRERDAMTHEPGCRPGASSIRRGGRINEEEEGSGPRR